MKQSIIDYLVCPERTPQCSSCLEDEGKTLRCGCGKTYNKVEGIPDLRNIDNQHSNNEVQFSCENKGDFTERYEDEIFIDMFLFRQYGPLVNITEEYGQNKYEECMPYRMPEIRNGCESFYQTLLSMALPYLESNSVVLDIGCGPGRLAGEIAKQGVGFTIGLDYFPSMIIKASNIILSQKSRVINLKIWKSRLQSKNATILGWGLENCGFVIADAHFLPTLEQTADFISCINLLHRVKNPQRVIREIERVIRPRGILLVSNSYDWHIDYTPQNLWFDNFSSQLDPTTWQMENEIDGLPYLSGLHTRKHTLTFNHVQVFRKNK